MTPRCIYAILDDLSSDHSLSSLTGTQCVHQGEKLIELCITVRCLGY